MALTPRSALITASLPPSTPAQPVSRIFPSFGTVMETSRVDLSGFVHISCLGLHTPFAEELLSLHYARPVETAMMIDRHRPRAIGVKIRLGAMTGDHGDAALELAIEAA